MEPICSEWLWRSRAKNRIEVTRMSMAKIRSEMELKSEEWNRTGMERSITAVRLNDSIRSRNDAKRNEMYV
jgi:hypothetical protein